ncbi:hypothetical protein AXG93_1913s1670 [Marchantia polymorpha subsp. ruderalis]|uniref:Uncharacterized protein n=1 Tax=Marchantia polymorpha subsp. ruderalis TaxID=1480154 RepID=A0A176WL15_MARPO|nr:hypothetical protein AXG93_1913s1670 [Marchantia polymorpha subsp. ruderalis]
MMEFGLGASSAGVLSRFSCRRPEEAMISLLAPPSPGRFVEVSPEGNRRKRSLSLANIERPKALGPIRLSRARISAKPEGVPES